MASSTTFFHLARELRQHILIKTYDVEGDTSPYAWSFREHKKGIDAWTAVLRKVDDAIDFTDDVDFVQQKWHDELLVARNHEEKIAEDLWEECNLRPNDLWKMTREGRPPWCQVWDSFSFARRFYNARNRTKVPHEDLRSELFDWWWDEGTSEVRWDKHGWKHRRSNWDTIGAAADEDIEWLKKWTRNYYSRQVRNPI